MLKFVFGQPLSNRGAAASQKSYKSVSWKKEEEQSSSFLLSTVQYHLTHCIVFV